MCGQKLQLVITDGCAGLGRALETIYPGARHQRCWVHKMRNILEKVRRRDEKRVKAEAQKIYLADNVASARRAFERFRFRWHYPAMVRQLQRDLPELLLFFACPRHLWRKLRTTNVIERCFVEVRRRTRPMVVFTNVEASIGSSMRFPVGSMKTGRTTPSNYLHKQLDVTFVAGSERHIRHLAVSDYV